MEDLLEINKRIKFAESEIKILHDLFMQRPVCEFLIAENIHGVNPREVFEKNVDKFSEFRGTTPSEKWKFNKDKEDFKDLLNKLIISDK